MTQPRRLLDVRDLSVSYGEAKALAGVSLHVAPGETVALLGANGAGKTTLLHALSGLKPKSSGQVEFDGRDIGDHESGPTHLGCERFGPRRSRGAAL